MLNVIAFRQLVWDWMHHYLHRLVGIEGIEDVDEVHQEVISVVVLLCEVGLYGGV
jgi:hypothetical protein